MSGEQTKTADEAPAGTNEQLAAADRPEPAEYAKFGGIIYGISAFGYFVTLFLTMTLADENSLLFSLSGVEGVSMMEGEELFIAAVGGMNTLITLAPLIAVALGLYYYFDRETIEPAHKPAAIAAAAGTAAAALGLLVLLVIFEPDMVDLSIGDEVTGLIGAVAGAAITAALTGFVLENYE